MQQWMGLLVRDKEKVITTFTISFSLKLVKRTKLYRIVHENCSCSDVLTIIGFFPVNFMMVFWMSVCVMLRSLPQFLAKSHLRGSRLCWLRDLDHLLCLRPYCDGILFSGGAVSAGQPDPKTVKRNLFDETDVDKNPKKKKSGKFYW